MRDHQYPNHKMSSSSFLITTMIISTTFFFFFFFFFFLFSISSSTALALGINHADAGGKEYSLAKKPRNIGVPSSLVLGLTHSRALYSPGPSTITTTTTTTDHHDHNSMMNLVTNTLDVVEPLREIRDGYLISLNLGTPPKVIQLYLDTGSDLTWVPCGNLSFDCMDCDDYRNNYKIMATYSPSYSSSSLRDLCGSPLCSDVHSSDNSYDPCAVAGCSLSSLVKGTCPRPCPSFAYTYGAGGVVIGTLTRDTLTTHHAVLTIRSSSGSTNTTTTTTQEIPNFCFGCVGSTYREPIGIAGFGRGLLSLPSQLGFLHKGFSHCFLAFKFANNPKISSPLVIGDLAISSNENLHFTPLLRSPIYPNYYYIGLDAIIIGNASTAAPAPSSLREFDTHGNGGMIIDSGTTYTHLPKPFYSRILSVLQSIITYPRAKEQEARTGFELCYRIPCPDNVIKHDDDDHLLPSITFRFSNNVSVVLPQGNYFYAMGAPTDSTVVKCLLIQSMDEEGSSGSGSGPAGVFGSFQQQNMKVVYDLEKERIGFQPMDCASAAPY